MSTIIAKSGMDTWVRDDFPNRNQGTGTAVRLQATHRQGLVMIPVTNIRGRTVLSATLTGVVRAGFVAQTVTVAPIAAGWWRRSDHLEQPAHRGQHRGRDGAVCAARPDRGRPERHRGDAGGRQRHRVARVPAHHHRDRC